MNKHTMDKTSALRQVNYIIRDLLERTDHPGADDSHMDADNLLTSIQSITSLANDTAMPNDNPSRIPEQYGTNSKNPTYPDFYHMTDGTACQQCKDFRKQIYDIEASLEEMIVSSSTRGKVQAERNQTILRVISHSADTSYVDEGAERASKYAAQIFNTKHKQQSLPKKHRDQIEFEQECATLYIGNPIPANDYLNNIFKLRTKRTPGMDAQPVTHTRNKPICGYATTNNKPCRNTVSSTAQRCAAGHPVTH